jgi:NADP-dependent 3-hydroxy acid dehydrogenase YdfG
VLNAGATPLPRPIHHHTWQTFSRNWEVDVQHVFHFTREALLAPSAPGSTVIALSSGAALRGSPLSGGYAGAKAAIRWLTGYAAEESQRAGLGIRFVSLLPQLTPATDLGARYVAAYAARQSGPAASAASAASAAPAASGPAAPAPGGPAGPPLTPDLAGQAITELAADPGYQEHAYVLTAEGLRPLA